MSTIKNKKPKTWDAAAARARRQMLKERADKLKPIASPVASLIIVPISRLARALGKETSLVLGMNRGIIEQMARHLEIAFDNYEPNGNDVLVCSYFKSGTNWTMQMAYQIAHLGAGDYDHIQDVIAWPDAPEPETSVSLHDLTPYQSPTGLRVIKVHGKASYVPFNQAAKYLCIVRDPKDAFVSSYHFLQALFLGQTMPSVETWIDLFLSKYSAQGIWHEFVASWWALRHEPNVLFMTYESMKADSRRAIEKIADVMGVELTAVQLDRVQHLSSFAHMKSIEEKFYPPIVSPLYQPGGTMIRKGQMGTASELLSPAQQQRIDDYCRAGLQALGSDFPYDEWYG